MITTLFLINTHCNKNLLRIYKRDKKNLYQCKQPHRKREKALIPPISHKRFITKHLNVDSIVLTILNNLEMTSDRS